MLASMAAEQVLRLLNDKDARTQLYTEAGGVVRWSAPDLAFATPGWRGLSLAGMYAQGSVAALTGRCCSTWV